MKKMNVRDYLEENVFIALIVVVVVTGGVVFSVTEYLNSYRVASAIIDCETDKEEIEKQLINCNEDKLISKNKEVDFLIGLRVINGIDRPVYIWNNKNVIIEINPPACKFMQSSRQELLGQPLLYIQDKIQRAIKNPEPWIKEQHDRQMIELNGQISKRTKIPMELKEIHPYYKDFKGAWLLETMPVSAADNNYTVTAFIKSY
jgi:PAS domain-containing protein